MFGKSMNSIYRAAGLYLHATNTTEKRSLYATLFSQLYPCSLFSVKPGQSMTAAVTRQAPQQPPFYPALRRDLPQSPRSPGRVSPLQRRGRAGRAGRSPLLGVQLPLLLPLADEGHGAPRPRCGRSTPGRVGPGRASGRRGEQRGPQEPTGLAGLVGDARPAYTGREAGKGKEGCRHRTLRPRPGCGGAAAAWGLLRVFRGAALTWLPAFLLLLPQN